MHLSAWFSTGVCQGNVSVERVSLYAKATRKAAPPFLSAYLAVYMPSYARLFRCTVRAFTLPEVNWLLELAPQFALPDPTHIGGLLGYILI